MELVTPFEFVEMFPEGKSLAIVGNAGTMMNSGLGKVIDSHDIVVRFNECALDGFENDVGSKTSILVANPYAETRKRPLLDTKKPDLVFIINPQTRRGELNVFKEWVGNNKVLFTYTPSLIKVKESDHTEGLTTGTYSLQLLYRILKPSKIFLTGFTMFSGKDSHYWKAGQPSGLTAHNMVRETEIFISIINNFGVRTKVTSDVWSVQEKAVKKYSKHVELFRG